VVNGSVNPAQRLLDGVRVADVADDDTAWCYGVATVRGRMQIVQADHVVAGRGECRSDVRADETRGAGDEYPQ
jgi:hypothetical protein